MNKEILTFHDLKEERELTKNLINEPKYFLASQIIMKNRQLDELESETKELQECQNGYYRLIQEKEKLIKYLEGKIEEHKDMCIGRLYSSIEIIEFETQIETYQEILGKVRGE